MKALLAQLALEFVSAYEALRDAVGQIAALLDSRVQAARALYLAARAGAPFDQLAEAA